MNQVFQQDLNTKELQPGGPLLINLLFKEPVELPDTQRVADVCRKHFGNVECREGDDKSVFITALDHMVEFEDGKAPVQFLMTSCMDFDGKTVDDFTRSQMWDCQESRDRILEECRYSMLATDFLARSKSRCNPGTGFQARRSGRPPRPWYTGSGWWRWYPFRKRCSRPSAAPPFS